MTNPTHARLPFAAILATALLALLVPAPLLAWTPGTHVFLGDALLRNLSMVPPQIAALLAAFPADFLYGSIAADTSITVHFPDAGVFPYADLLEPGMTGAVVVIDK